MCGILCFISNNGKNCSFCNCIDKNHQFLKHLLQRRGPDKSDEICINHSLTKNVHFIGNVLWTRGIEPEGQPYQKENKLLLFNGDLYNFSNPNLNDGIELFNQILEKEDFTQIDFESFEGPFAIIYYSRDTPEYLYFCRDFIGKSSLVLSVDDDKNVIISSLGIIAGENSVIEIPSLGIFRINILTFECELYSWKNINQDKLQLYIKPFSNFCKQHNLNFRILEQKISSNLEFKLNSVINEEDDIFKKLSELNFSLEDSNFQKLEKASKILEKEIDTFLKHLRKSISKRIFNIPSYCKNCLPLREICSHSKVSVLFSGGLDSCLLAYLTAELINENEPLDLINVAFFKDEKSIDIKSTPPDRLTGEQSFKVLTKLFPNKKLNFIKVNILKEEVQEKRTTLIKHLISPLNSVLDDSIGCCLWFAANRSNSRILIVGSGADELFGGYSRHKTTFQNKGFKGLSDDLELEIERIGSRNLNRDNRIISDCGLSLRLPFLDEILVSHIFSLPIYIKCYSTLFDKLLLRASLFKLTNDFEICLFPKRAMQFGSRIAKLENSKEKGNHICNRLI